MRRPIRWTIGLGCLAGFIALGSMVVGIASCGTAPTPFLVQGPSQFGNDPPTLEITEPIANITRGQGDPFLIRWTDTDRDSNATIRFSLLNTETNALIVLVEGLDENDRTGTDTQLVGTGLIPVGTYNILGTISDEDTSVEVFATTAGTTPQRVIVTIVGEGGGPQTVPPILTVTAPAFNLSVAQDDELVVLVQPSALVPVITVPFDPDSGITLYLVLDLDLDPNNDDPANPDPSQIIVLESRNVAVGAFAEESFTRRIDLATVPARASGEPYFIRVTADDGTNPRVHQYAVGTINVVQLAAGTVDLSDVGRKLSGARLYGFNPGANVGSSVANVKDFDADGIDDFVVVARFGNPQNVGPVGEAYLLYGRDNLRFGGTISVNSISQTVSGVVFAAPPVRRFVIPALFPETLGITDVGFIRDLTGDGRPDLLFGLPLVHGALDSTDYDPGDDPPQPQEGGPFGCYPDLIVNNFASTVDGPFPAGPDSYFYAGGMAVMVNSQNRDAEGDVNVVRLESTVVNLELAGQPFSILDADGFNGAGNIFPRASNNRTEDLGTDSQEAGRIAGGRFIGGGFDWIEQLEPARADLYGQQVGSLGDLSSDGLDEVVISAPRNERYINDLVTTRVDGRAFSTHLSSTLFFGSIMVLPGRNYNTEDHRDRNDDLGSAVTPFLDQWNHPAGSCTGSPPAPRHYDIPIDFFEIFAEDIDDMLGDGQSAGDFNQDGLDDILCGAPLNDRRTTLLDTGA
ncbi:MAG: integrin alpha, partial [Planctomycetota bacterium]